jgi:hypothetical protein
VLHRHGDGSIVRRPGAPSFECNAAHTSLGKIPYKVGAGIWDQPRALQGAGAWRESRCSGQLPYSLRHYHDGAAMGVGDKRRCGESPLGGGGGGVILF